MTPTLRTHLEDLLDRAQWQWLESHVLRGRVLVVAESLSLVDVGLALAEDRTADVRQWIDDAWLYQPTTDQIKQWQGAQPQFPCLIIQPFILIHIHSDAP
ncbi:MAG: DUF2288 domain-containing protein [Oscillatoriales cyanobacterium SM2_2_1]|nr:DUF2288 domain-containing protein [Oscillatoriales cyanobacterium SM2_2_1]